MNTVTLEHVSAYFDGELPPAERQNVATHIAGCTRCQQAMAAWHGAARELVAVRSNSVQRHHLSALVVGVATLLLATSTIALATGLFSEVFRSGPVNAVASRPVTLDGARVADLPLPTSGRLPGGWSIDDVQLSMTPEWRAVDVHYQRPGSRGLGFTVYSTGINVNINSTPDRRRIVLASGQAVDLMYAGESVMTQFEHHGSKVIVRAFIAEVNEADLRVLLDSWVEQAR